jgi:hypothetical protein
VAARENEHVASNTADGSHHAVGAATDVGRRFAPRAAVAEQQPSGVRSQNFSRALALVVAIVPFDQVVFDFGYVAEAGKRARLPGSL